MRDSRFEIRRFNFTQLAKLTQLVGEHKKEDLHVFYKYFLNCIELDFYSKKVLSEFFSSFTALFHLFVKEGFITTESHNRFYYIYMLNLKEKIEKDGVSAVGFNDII